MTTETERHRVLLVLERAKNRELLESWVAARPGYEVVAPSTGSIPDLAFDLCVVDAPSFPRHRERIRRRKEEERPTFLPVLLVRSAEGSRHDPEAFEVVDDVIATPIGKETLAGRVENLLERRRLSRELYERFERSEKRFRRIFESSNDAIFVIDTEADEIVECNPSACALVGYSRNQLLSLSPTTDLHPDDLDAYRSFVERVREEGQGWTDELTYRMREGRRLWAEVSAAAVEAGGRSSVVMCVRDVTQRKRRQQQVQILNRVLRHNIRNDMNVVQGYASTLEAALDDDGLAADARRIVATSEDLIELSRKTWELNKTVHWQQDPRPVDVVETVDSVARNLEDAYPEATVRTDLPDEARAVADDRIDRALWELCQNAVEYAEEPEPVVDVSASVEADSVVVEIADQGPGIPDQEQAVVEGEETPLQHGSGLGLWLVNWIVTDVGGSMTLADDEPRGSVVTLRLARDRALDTGVPGGSGVDD